MKTEETFSIWHFVDLLLHHSSAVGKGYNLSLTSILQHKHTVFEL